MKNFILLLSFTFILSLQAQQGDFNEIDFTKAEQIAQRYKGETLYNLPLLTHRLTAQLDTDVERFRAIYYWVCHNISGAYDMMSMNNRKRHRLKNDPEGLQQWNKKFKKEVFAKLRRDKTTLCTGYAYLIKVMSAHAGLECSIINGYDTTLRSKEMELPNHSWNAIKLNGKWYLCDATWSSGYTDIATYLFEFEYDNSYFLMHPADFIKTHMPVIKKWTLLDTVSDPRFIKKEDPIRHKKATVHYDKI